jgi:hypothetical protein
VATRKLGLDSMISAKPCRERDLVLAIIVERLLDPCSKLATDGDPAQGSDMIPISRGSTRHHWSTKSERFSVLLSAAPPDLHFANISKDSVRK